MWPSKYNIATAPSTPPFHAILKPYSPPKDGIAMPTPEIDAIKKRRQETAVDQAKGAIATLASTDKSAYARLMRWLDPERPPDA